MHEVVATGIAKTNAAYLGATRRWAEGAVQCLWVHFLFDREGRLWRFMFFIWAIMLSFLCVLLLWSSGRVRTQELRSSANPGAPGAKLPSGLQSVTLEGAPVECEPRSSGRVRTGSSGRVRTEELRSTATGRVRTESSGRVRTEELRSTATRTSGQEATAVAGLGGAPPAR